MRIENGLPVLELESFITGMKKALPSLIRFLNSDRVRQHPIWGQLLPFHVRPYGTGRSPGHIVRPDIVITEHGPRITEIDFVPSGRGFLLSVLREQEQRDFLRSFSQWYRDMGADKVSYGTTTKDGCRPEVRLFAERLRDMMGVDIQAHDMDTEANLVNGHLVDRLFYWSELPDRTVVDGKNIMTREPWLDSKMIFAMIHHSNPEMTQILEEEIGAENLRFLRKVIPHTEALDLLDETVLRARFSTKEARAGVVIKSTDVETDESWGARGTSMPRRGMSATQFFKAVIDRVPPKGKSLGDHPVLQDFEPSLDFTQVWNGAVDGRIRLADPDQLDRPLGEVTSQYASWLVFARVGVYFLLNNETDSVIVPPYGIVTLRQNEVAHGAADSMITAFEIN